jgi:hypothetical protein
MIRYLIAATLAIPLFASVPAGGWAQEAPAGADADFQAYVGDKPPAFDTIEDLVKAFTVATAGGNDEALAALLGLSPGEVLKSDDVRQSIMEIRQAAAQAVALKQVDGDRQVLLLGNEVWPFPFPAVKADGKWSFDTIAGLEEVINRRIGENELAAIANLRAYVEAQENYKQTDLDEDGVAEFAQKLVSTPGTYDGLYWQEGDGVPESPIGGLIDQAEAATAAEDGYFGYRYRVLTGQGANVAGGAYDYIINGNMIAGFGLIATPAKYDRTGIQTFIINQYGTIYEKDLGNQTEEAAAKITTFDPDDSWTVVDDPGE